MESDDSYSGDFEIRLRKPAMAFPSPFRFHMKAMLKRRKVLKKKTFVSSKTNRNKSDKLLIRKGMVDYETESESGCNEILDQGKDVPNVEHERVRNISMEIDNGDKEESEEDELCVLQDALDSTSSFSGYQQKLLLDNLKKLNAEKRRELSDEWKAFLHEKMQLNIKKLIFAAKLASTTVSS